MTRDPLTVAIVVDPEFGERLRGLVARMPVWIARTPTNAPIIHALFVEAGRSVLDSGVTDFSVDPRASPDEWCVNILYMVDLHHGRASQNPPYRAVEVYGTQPTPAVRTALSEYGLTQLESTPDGFRATLTESPE